MFQSSLVNLPVNGCDSVAILNLTITQPDTSFIEVTACDSYEWNGEIYAEKFTNIQIMAQIINYSMSFNGEDNFIEFDDDNIFNLNMN